MSANRNVAGPLELPSSTVKKAIFYKEHGCWRCWETIQSIWNAGKTIICIWIYVSAMFLCFMNVPHFRFSGFSWTKSDFAVKTYSVWSKLQSLCVCPWLYMASASLPPRWLHTLDFIFFIISFLWQLLRLGPVAAWAGVPLWGQEQIWR